MTMTSQLSENSHRGFEGIKAALYLGSTGVKSNTAVGMQLRLRRNSIGSRSSGKERDAETGLDFFLARYYSGAQGRFLSPDKPMADQHAKLPQTWNLYTYARNNPLRFVDDSGLAVKDIVLKTSGDNEVTNKSQELGNVSQLGPKANEQHFGFAVNIIATVTDDDNPNNYKPSQKSFIIAPKVDNTDPLRPNEWGVVRPDNPESQNVKADGNQLKWADNPGFKTPGTQAGTNAGFLAIFSSTVTPQKGTSGTPTDKVLYWGVQFNVVDGKIVNPVATQITDKQYMEFLKKYNK
jgi:RHS repeat-associated protein